MVIRMQRALIIIMAAAFILGVYDKAGPVNVYASEKEHAVEQKVEHKEEEGYQEDLGKHGKSEEVHGQEGEKYEGEAVHDAGGAPLTYYLYWVGLIVIVLAGGRYLLAYKRGEAAKDDLRLAKTLIAVAIFLYIMNQSPVLKAYHEPVSIGFVRFLAKLGAGIIMTFFSFTWMHEHH